MRTANKGPRRGRKRAPATTSPRRAPSCPKVPVCLLDVVRAGRPVALEARGERWAIVEPGVPKPIAARKHKAVAEDLLATAYSQLERDLRVACPPRLESREALVFTPQRPQGEPVRFDVLEAADVVSSHDPQSFAPDPGYPREVQERVYDRDPNEQRKVMVGAQNLNPAVVLNRSPTPEAGPPLVTAGEHPIVLGGNGRSMMIRRAYAENLPVAGAYRTELVRRAAEFGLVAGDVEKLRAPVLVRVVLGLTASSPVRELSAAVRRYNETMTAAMDDRARAVAKARQLSENTVAALGELLAGAGEASLRDVMRDKPEAFLRLLEADGLVTPQNRAEWSAGGALTDRAKDELEGMFLGRVLGSSQRLSATSPATLRKVERAVPFLVRVEGVNPPFSRIATLQAAVDLVNEAQSRKLTLEQLLDQAPLFGKRTPDPAAEELARVLLEEGQRAVAERFRRWADVAAYDPRQTMLFGRPPTVDEANAALFRRLANPCGCPFRRPNPDAVGPGEERRSNDGRTERIAPPGTELRVIIESAGKSAAGVELFRPALALVDIGTSKVREVYSRGETTKTALETALDAAKRLARSQGLTIDAGGLLIEPAAPRKGNPGPRRLVAHLETPAATTRALARELLLGFGRQLAGATVLVRRPGKRPPLRIRFDSSARPREVFVGGTPNADLRAALAADLRLLKPPHGQRRQRTLQSGREVRMREPTPSTKQPQPPAPPSPAGDDEFDEELDNPNITPIVVSPGKPITNEETDEAIRQPASDDSRELTAEEEEALMPPIKPLRPLTDEDLNAYVRRARERRDE